MEAAAAAKARVLELKQEVQGLKRLGVSSSSSSLASSSSSSSSSSSTTAAKSTGGKGEGEGDGSGDEVRRLKSQLVQALADVSTLQQRVREKTDAAKHMQALSQANEDQLKELETATNKYRFVTSRSDSDGSFFLSFSLSLSLYLTHASLSLSLSLSLLHP